MDKEKIEIKVSDFEKDKDYLKQFLLEPGVLDFFPMQGEKEAEDSARIWISYAKLKACFTLMKNDVPIGICAIYPHYAEKIAHQSLISIVITEKERGKGYGKMLLEHLEKEAKQTFNMHLLHLEVYEGNPAMRLYERMGYKQYGIHKRFLKEADGTYKDKILMEKWID